jgi:hypothetical protein
MRKRHLTKEERDSKHNPASDWCESPRGEECRSFYSLELDDLLDKHKIERKVKHTPKPVVKQNEVRHTIEDHYAGLDANVEL